MRIKAISFVVVLIGAVAIWSSGASAAGPATFCPANFQCGFSLVQTKPLTDPNNPGQPSVIIGYMSFDASKVPTVFFLQNKDGALQTLGNNTGTCADGANGSPATLNFTGTMGPLIRFVTFNTGAEVRFITTNGTTGMVQVTIGSCRQL